MKKYQNQDEERFHRDIFLQNINEISKNNQLYEKGIVSYTMGLNVYSDLSHTEFVSRINGGREKNLRYENRVICL